MYRRPSILVILLFGLSHLSIGQTEGSNYFNQSYIYQERIFRGLVFDILQDKHGLMWFGTEYGLIRYDGHHVKRYAHEPSNLNSLAGNVVTALAEDKQGNLWIGTQNSGLHYFDRNEDKFYRFQHHADDKNAISNNKISKILIGDQNSIWITTEGGGINRYKVDVQKFTTFNAEPPGPSSYAIWQDANDLWIGDYYGLNRWDPMQDRLERYAKTTEPFLDFNSLKILREGYDGTLWAGFRNGGLRRISADRKTFLPIVTSPAWPSGPKPENIWDILAIKDGSILAATDGGLFHLQLQAKTGNYALSEYLFTEEKRYLALHRSQDGILWLGTNNGVIVLAPRHKPFQVIAPRHPEEDIGNERGISTITKAAAAKLWIGTIDGIWQFDLDKGVFTRDYLSSFPALQVIKDENISVLFQDSQAQLWIAIIKGFNSGFGLYQFNLEANQLKDHSATSSFLHSYPFRDIHEGPNGAIWFATHGGLIHFNPIENHFSLVEAEDAEGLQLKDCRINVINDYQQGKLILGTNSNGTYIYEPESNKLTPLSKTLPKQDITINPRVIEFSVTADKTWIGTAGGLFLLDPKSQMVEGFDQQQGLADNVVKTIMVDQRQQTWIGTQSALSKWNDDTKSLTTYVRGDGLDMEEFWDRAGYLSTHGKLYFGGDDGLLIFNPDSVMDNTFKPPITFTQFDLFNRVVPPSPKHNILSKSIEARPTIHLQHRQNVFTIHYAALSYINPSRNLYSVKMEGFQDDWQPMGNETEATYTNLNPGTYYFRVRASNNDGVWNNDSPPLTIVVAPPWYLTWWALGTYLIASFLAILFLYRFQLQRKMAQLETKRLQELDLVKTELYTHITHEFRTPLSLIQGPVERAISDQGYRLGQKELAIIRNNCRRLLRLIQQILDLNKLEANALTLRQGHGDLVPAVRFLVNAFSSFALSQDIQLQFSSQPAEIYTDYDPEGISEILSNLLLNACKFTAAGGRVQVSIHALDAKVDIRIEDTGQGIPAEELDNIFDHFYQAKKLEDAGKTEVFRSGTGIGLSMAKRLAELMDGELSVTSKVGVGSCFTLSLPINKDFEDRPINNQNVAPYIPQLPIETYTPEQTNTLHAPEVLVVDDNVEMANFIANCLPQNFKVTLAYDGKEGLKIAEMNIPDLIISDVMMPKIDGFQLTENLKKDIRTSHIPIILLTARSDMSDRLQGLKTGSEVFLTKPFHQQELIIQVENLLDNRRRLQQYYLRKSGLQNFSSTSLDQNPTEDKFLQKVRRLIEEKIGAQAYSIEELAKELHLSTSQLYRKMMALTGQSTSKFFRSVQLKKATALLQNSDLNISEIAYQSGFNEPAYFSRVFTAEFGLSPSQYREQNIGAN
ncbi:MAG: response regulator [Saprospiraceae bacterium]|nr:response regulator [Saprospiraceae bacterium]